MNLSFWLLGSLCVAYCQGHEWGFGSCPSVAPFPNLSLDKFLGLWYVIEQFDTTSTCLTMNYTRVSETSLTVTKNRQFFILDRAGLDHSNSYTGSLDIPFSNNPGLLRVKWPLNAAGKGDYIIFDTDYETYAGVYDCQQITFFLYRESSSILSRKPTLDEVYVDRVKRRLETFKVDTVEFVPIDHANCRSKEESNFKLDVDQNTFKKIFSGAADSINDVAGQIATGVKDAANTVVDGVKKIGGSFEFTKNGNETTANEAALDILE